MRKRIFSIVLSIGVLGLSALMMGKTASAKTDVQAFAGKLADGQRIEVLYVKSTQKLAVAVKNKDGKYVRGMYLRASQNRKVNLTSQMHIKNLEMKHLWEKHFQCIVQREI